MTIIRDKVPDIEIQKKCTKNNIIKMIKKKKEKKRVIGKTGNIYMVRTHFNLI